MCVFFLFLFWERIFVDFWFCDNFHLVLKMPNRKQNTIRCWHEHIRRRKKSAFKLPFYEETSNTCWTKMNFFLNTWDSPRRFVSFIDNLYKHINFYSWLIQYKAYEEPQTKGVCYISHNRQVWCRVVFKEVIHLCTGLWFKKYLAPSSIFQ